MKLSYPNIFLLYKTRLIDKYRRIGIFTFFFGAKADYKRIVNTKMFLFLFYLVAGYLIPILSADAIRSSANHLNYLVFYKEFLWDAALAFVFYLGMFIGANLLYELCIKDNFLILTLPFTIEDLVYFRLAEVSVIILKLIYYLILPLFLFISILADFGIGSAIAILMTNLLTSILFYVLGIAFMLLLNKLFPRFKPDSLFINIALVTLAVLVLAIKFLKNNMLGFDDFISLLNKDIYNIYYSPAHAVSMSLRNNALFNIVLIIVFNVSAIFFLSKQALKILEKNYKRIHLYSGIVLTKTFDKQVLTFGIFNKLLKSLPVRARAILIKDLITLIRKPYLMLKILLIVLTVVFFSFQRLENIPDFNPRVFSFYFLLFFIIGKLFVNAIGFEKNNIYFLKQTFTSANSFLITRFIINLVCSFVILLPLTLYYIFTEGSNYNLSELIVYSCIVIVCILSSTLLVTGFSSYFALFDNKYSYAAELGISPFGMVILWISGIIHSAFFYAVHNLMLHSKAILSVSLINVFGGVIFLLAVLMMNGGGKKIERTV